MIRLERPPITAVLGATERTTLAGRVAEVAKLKAGDKKITSRRDSFVAGKGKDRGVGPRVCAAARKMSWEKCAYCESPKAATVDHFWPKKHYPARMFHWDNLFPACRDCNSEKRTGFPLANQQAVLLNPVDDEPLDHFRWDHVTGECTFAQTNLRASATHRGFALDRLKAERLHKLNAFRFLLARAASEPVDVALKTRLQDELAAERPYLGVVRSYLLFPPNAREASLIQAAVAAVPDIVAWTQPWLRPPAGVAWPPP